MACEIFPVTFVFVVVVAVVAVGGCHCANGLLNQLFLRTYSNYNDGNFKVMQFICINKSSIQDNGIFCIIEIFKLNIL